MLSKKEVKDIQSLSHKKAREEMGLFLAEGPKIVAEWMDIAPGQIEKIYAVEDWIRQNPSLRNVPLQEVKAFELAQLSQLHTSNNVVAVLKKKTPVVPDAAALFCLYLDTIQDPGNLGTIIRIGDWFGIQHVVCSKDCADAYNPKVVQATMASLARVNCYYDEEGSWLDGQQTTVYAATLDGTSVYKEPKTGTGVLIIGNESKGISDTVLSHASRRVMIPRKGEAESLNAAVATGIILSHLLE
jgi:TrmH family RNA methyltransferase